MAAMLTTDSLRFAIVRLKEKMEACADELNELDGALGDGDLGVTMTTAARRLLADLPNLPDDLGMALFQCAQAFTRVTASTYGTLLATGLMAAAKATRGRAAVPWTEVSALLGAAVKAMSDRGKGQLGDKTVLDAVEAARHAPGVAIFTATGAAYDGIPGVICPVYFRPVHAFVSGGCSLEGEASFCFCCWASQPSLTGVKSQKYSSPTSSAW